MAMSEAEKESLRRIDSRRLLSLYYLCAHDIGKSRDSSPQSLIDERDGYAEVILMRMRAGNNGF